MQPIRFSCAVALDLSADEVVQEILNVANWSDFAGYGPLPGIQSAEMERRTPEIVGTRIRVTNRDGSGHVEEIVEWLPGRRLRMNMHAFTPPLSRLATHFIETWDFEPLGSGTKVNRSFQLHARSMFSWPLLALISILLKKAIARHLAQMRKAS